MARMDSSRAPFFSDKLALVTGASRGLGKAMALALARAGASVALTARDASRLQQVQAEIASAGGRAEIFTADVSVEADVQSLHREVSDRMGAPHILINNAGMNIRKAATDFTLAEWRQILDTNLTSVFLLCREFVPAMKGRGYGRIINLTSIMSHVALPGRTAYAASKAGLLGYTKALALELASEKITVNGISPGPFATEMNQVLIQNPAANADFLSRIPLGVWGKVEDIGQLAVYLCGPDAGFITGTDLLIDGGWTAQ
jgi:NAD(P)-dependent dehydrogenase (short-subunit alcohol dehydrogenase family)